MFVIEKTAPELRAQIEMCWSSTSEGKTGGTFYEIFPAGNVDLVFRFSDSGCRMVLLGPATENAYVEIHEESHYFGIRFRTGQTPRLPPL